VNCRDLFRTTETFQGYCCSFNIKKPSKALSSELKNQKARKTEYFGPDMGLSVVIRPLIEKKAMTSVNSEGIKILINENMLYTSEKTIERMLPHKMETLVEVRPERTISSRAISALPISDRGCVFSDEIKMRFFPNYNENNCVVECKMEKIIQLCDCLPYFYYNTENTELCDVKKLQCIIENRKFLKKLKRPENVTEKDCVCPTQCDSTTFQIRMSSTDINLDLMKHNIDPFQ
jgi:amiloride-sensitive sodium channel